MTSIYEISSIAQEGVSYLRCDPPINNFIPKYKGRLLISNSQRTIAYSFSDLDLDSRLGTFYSTLLSSVFVKGRTVITWDIKQLMSYLHHRLKDKFRYGSFPNIVDLKYGLSFTGQKHGLPPETYADAIKQCKTFINSAGWKRANSEVHIPLAMNVLPCLETRAVSENGVQKYSCYEIEGQVNGRLRCYQPAANFLNVHNLKPEQKSVISVIDPKEEEYKFIVVDYNHMEVSMLQWITQDQDLGISLRDVRGFYSSLVDFDCPDAMRHKIGKLVFLQVLYGMQPKNLAEGLKITLATADRLISGMKRRFRIAFDWLESKQRDLSNDPIAIDCFGHARDFNGQSSYLRRNFEIQTPAALVCCERLVAMFSELSQHMLFHIHDGYVLFAKPKDELDVAIRAKEILESESKLCPGLKLNVSCSSGVRLNEMVAIDVKNKIR